MASIWSVPPMTPQSEACSPRRARWPRFTPASDLTQGSGSLRPAEPDSHKRTQALVPAGMYRAARARMRALRSRIVLPSAYVGDLLFGQQHIFTQEYFASRNPAYHTVPVCETPHFHALSASDGEADYLDYLERSWEYYRPHSNVPSEREARLERFHGLREAVQSAGGILEPVRIFRRPDGRRVIIDGNHRAAIALALGLDLLRLMFQHRMPCALSPRRRVGPNGSTYQVKACSTQARRSFVACAPTSDNASSDWTQVACPERECWMSAAVLVPVAILRLRWGQHRSMASSRIADLHQQP